MQLKSKRIILRSARESDAKDIQKNINDFEVYRYTANIPHPYKLKHVVDFIKKCKKELKEKKKYYFIIIFEGKLVGGIDLHNVDLKNKNAEIGYWLGRKYWNKGIMTESLKLLLDFTFKKLKLHKLKARVFEPNIASKRVLEKNGFKVEGFFKDEIFKHKKFFNAYYLALLRKEYKG